MSNLTYFHTLNFEPKKDAFSYQKEAFDAVKDLEYAAIFHEQGLGKTKIAIDLILYWLEKCNIDTVMVVTKKQLVTNWIQEFSIHTHIHPKVLNQDKKNNFYLFNSTTRVLVTNFETISSEKETMLLYLKTRDVGIIIDESTKIKNPESKLTKDFFLLAPLFKRRVIMTGTPVANRPYDIWAQVFFLDFGESLGKDFDSFKKDTDLRNDFDSDEKGRKGFEDSVSKIFSRIKQFSVRETKNSGIIHLPQKVYHDEICSFEQTQLEMYKQIQYELNILIQKDGEAILDNSEASLKRLLRLIQVASNPRLIDELYCTDSGKERRLSKLLKAITDGNEKVIVWSNFIENVDFFQKLYKQYNPVKIHGKMAIEDRNRSVAKFKNDPECKVLFATPQSAKEGLTLTVANNVIFYDRGFNLDDYLQAQDRIHRISQEKTCHVYNLIIKNSIDEWISTLLQAKQNAAFLAQGDYELAKFNEQMDYSYGKLIREILSQEAEE